MIRSGGVSKRFTDKAKEDDMDAIVKMTHDLNSL